ARVREDASASVCREFELCRRRHLLTFNHHAEVQVLEPDKLISHACARMLPMFREAMKGKPGRPPKERGNNVTPIDRPQKGNSKAYTLSRLQREDATCVQLWQFCHSCRLISH